MATPTTTDTTSVRTRNSPHRPRSGLVRSEANASAANMAASAKPVVEAAFGGQRVTDAFGDALVFEQCIDQRDLGRRDDRGQTHRLPQRHDGQNQECGQRPEAERQRNSDDKQAERDASAAHHPTEVELGRLGEQDDRQRQLGDDGEVRGVGGTVDELEPVRPQHDSEQHEDQRRRRVPLLDQTGDQRVAQHQDREHEDGVGVHEAQAPLLGPPELALGMSVIGKFGIGAGDGVSGSDGISSTAMS